MMRITIHNKRTANVPEIIIIQRTRNNMAIIPQLHLLPQQQQQPLPIPTPIPQHLMQSLHRARKKKRCALIFITHVYVNKDVLTFLFCSRCGHPMWKLPLWKVNCLRLSFYCSFFSFYTIALETIPKLGRRKILVNGKPCGNDSFTVTALVALSHSLTLQVAMS